MSSKTIACICPGKNYEGEDNMAKEGLTKKDLLSAIEKMTVLELADLVKALEEKFGVSAAAPAVAVAPSAAPATGGEATPVEEKTEFSVFITATSSTVIACCLQASAQIPQPVHFSVSTIATMEDLLLNIFSPLLNSLIRFEIIFICS